MEKGFAATKEENDSTPAQLGRARVPTNIGFRAAQIAQTDPKG
jgi:hypothetical protein